MELILFVGDCNEELSEEAKAYDSSAFLIQNSNYKKILKQFEKKLDQTIVAYTSMADLPKVTETLSFFYEILNIASKIFYRPPETWSDEDSESEFHSMQRLTEYYLFNIQCKKNNVNGLNLDHWTKKCNFLKLQDTPTEPGNTLWVAGCSITEGVGVDIENRYANYLSQSLQRSLVMLGKGGTGNEFAADQILRSDIKSTDIVVWGLTSEFRSTEWDSKNNDILNINPYNFEESEKGNLDGMSIGTRLYKSITSINQVINFCRKVGCLLYIFPILPSENLVLQICNYPEFCSLLHRSVFIDLGSDNSHPGPKQHAWYAEEMLKHINKNNYDEDK